MPDVEPITLSTLVTWAKKTARFDRQEYQQTHRALTATRLLRTVIPNLHTPVFIIGAPRSGTTFLGKCLGSLPEISYHNEPVATKAAARYVYEDHWGHFRAGVFYRAVYAWLMRLHADGDLRFAEKTPRNCFLVQFLHDTFPTAQFIHIIRDGRDAALSYSQKPWLQAAQTTQNQREPGGYRFGPYPRFWVEPDRHLEFQTTSDIHRCIWAWRRHVESALAVARQLPTPQYCEIRYETLVSQPQAVGQTLLTFLNITQPDSTEQLLSRLSTARTDSVGRWQSQLTSEQLDDIQQEASNLLAALGYL